MWNRSLQWTTPTSPERIPLWKMSMPSISPLVIRQQWPQQPRQWLRSSRHPRSPQVGSCLSVDRTSLACNCANRTCAFYSQLQCHFVLTFALDDIFRLILAPIRHDLISACRCASVQWQSIHSRGGLIWQCKRYCTAWYHFRAMEHFLYSAHHLVSPSFLPCFICYYFL